MATVGLCVIKKSAKTAKLDNVFEHIFTPRIYQVSHIVTMQFRRFVVISTYFDKRRHRLPSTSNLYSSRSHFSFFWHIVIIMHTGLNKLGWRLRPTPTEHTLKLINAQLNWIKVINHAVKGINSNHSTAVISGCKSQNSNNSKLMKQWAQSYVSMQDRKQ